ncbi:class I SAM-dependent methyltransferase [Arthrobacter sp. CJ23]|uniref:class I SAM-dependent methyltransferase n=1 Tax=Arthrobacter sp. CJ23 TaxID=2972479 RepID=UPI00215BFCEE|nr:class I SAM-dependent methyltransferase [Arthrobacter sp. CJ23]UVJ40270.1 class I SAM-dependent methyltransferase [Arthrobacter sp. CJ23]
MSRRTGQGSRALLHDEVRPPWRQDVVSWLLGSPAPGERLSVLDLGAGTGLGSRTIAALGHTVTAMDTAEDMLSVLEAASLGLPPDIAGRITARLGSAERLPLDDRTFDAVVCLQAWHWVDPASAVAECDRVLVPGGMVGLAWHTWDRSKAWVRDLAAIVEPGGAARDQTASVPSAFAGRGGFERRRFPFDYELNVDQLVQLASSWTFVSQRPERQAILAEVRLLGAKAASPHTGLLAFPHVTDCYRLQRRATDR